MVIKILGDCCSHCSILHSNTVQAVKELDLDNITVEQEGDILKILQYKIIRTPALLINEQVLSEGEALSVKKIKEIISNEIIKSDK